MRLYVDKECTWIRKDQRKNVNEYLKYLKNVRLFIIDNVKVVFGEISATKYDYLQFEHLQNMLKFSNKEKRITKRFSLFSIDYRITNIRDEFREK